MVPIFLERWELAPSEHDVLRLPLPGGGGGLPPRGRSVSAAAPAVHVQAPADRVAGDELAAFNRLMERPTATERAPGASWHAR